MSALPNTMRRIEVDQPGPAERMRIGHAPLPSPKPGELLIEVAYAGVNRPDVIQRSGNYPPPPDASPILGLEIAGTVAALGDGVTSWRVGDAVCALTPGGGYAEYCTTPATWALPPPPGLSMRDAASLPENYFTVWHNVFERGHLSPGETFLVHGGSSGIGLTAIQLAKAFGATVITTVGNAEKAAFCRKIGADHVVNYREADFQAEVASITQKRGVNLILDMVGGDYIERNLRSLALEGRLVIIAFLQGSKVEADWRFIMLKRLTVTGSTMRASPSSRKAEIARALRERVWPLFGDGKLEPVVTREFALEDAPAAHALMESSAHIGKIMLRVK
ncbi:MAG TPA: NAD(P)H-quinone oxidoreductase [Casimicrobiaceae bacterium]|jgi:NADPH2:quinone reductase|nr:NAD(P)H-quinone oxidoreductase [Casimicrobiaceae bacterium]